VPAGLEAYTEEHWAILSPAALGFRGRQKLPPESDVSAAEADMAKFFAPHNARLDELMAAHAWQWSPFRAADGH
jgi:hypothetical protein